MMPVHLTADAGASPLRPLGSGHRQPLIGVVAALNFMASCALGRAGQSVTGDLATVDMEDLARDVGRRLQEQNAVDDVADLAHAPERCNTLAECLISFRRI